MPEIEQIGEGGGDGVPKRTRKRTDQSALKSQRSRVALAGLKLGNSQERSMRSDSMGEC